MRKRKQEEQSMSDGMNRKSTVRKGICIAALFVVLNVVCLAIDYRYDCPYLYNLVLVLMPVWIAYVGATYFGNTYPVKWTARKWWTVVLIVAVVAVGLTWLGENL